MKKFEIGRTYTMRSICDHDCVWTYTITKRTAQTVTITDGKETKTCRICKQASQYRDAETIHPLGRYSMAPSLSADNEQQAEPEQAETPAPTCYTVSKDLLALGLLGAMTGRLNAKQLDFLGHLADNAAQIV